MKHIAIVSPHFVPSNLTAVHRARLLVEYLPEFGWQPTVITVHEKYYEEPLEPELCHLLPEHLQIRKAWAFPTRPVRLVGDIGIRGFLGMYQEIKKLHSEHKIDFLYITIPSNYAALLGPLCHKILKIPYGIDYIDPWVHEWPGTDKRLSKAWLSLKLGQWLEPRAVQYAKLISGVAPAYFGGVFERNPRLKNKVLTVAMPYGWTNSEIEYLESTQRKSFLFSPDDGLFHLAYAGAMLPKAYELLGIFFQALTQLIKERKSFMANFRLHFVGTGKNPSDAKGHNIFPLIQKYQLEEYVDEFPQRIPYLDVLRHLKSASAIFILGSPEGHYTPSKIFQSMLSGKPIFALLHEQSTAVKMIEECQAGEAVTINERLLPEPADVAQRLKKFMEGAGKFKSVDLSKLEKYSARECTRSLVIALDRILSGKP